MAMVPTVFVRAAASVTLTTTLATVTTGKKWIVTSIIVTNTASSSATFDLAFDGVKVFKDAPIAANSTAIFDLKQVIDATKLIQGGASAVTVNFHISGVEQ
jgi:hypothetical protein